MTMSKKSQKENSNIPSSPGESGVPLSPICRKIFFEEGVALPTFHDVPEEIKECQKLKWNFDFQTETPLPGRYLWERTEGCSGYFNFKNGRGAPQQQKRPPPEEGTKLSSKHPRPCHSEDPENNRLSEPELEPAIHKDAQSGKSCDTALNESQESIRLHDTPFGIDLT